MKKEVWSSKIPLRGEKLLSARGISKRIKKEVAYFRWKWAYISKIQYFKHINLSSYDKKIIMLYVLFTETQRVNFEPRFKFFFP